MSNKGNGAARSSTGNEILASVRLPHKEVILTAEMGFDRNHTVYVWALDSFEQGRYNKTLYSVTSRQEMDAKNPKAPGKLIAEVIPDHWGARLLAVQLATKDESGRRLFANVEAVGRLPGKAVEALWEAVDELSALSAEAQEEVGKESATTMESEETSASPSPSESQADESYTAD